MNTLAHRRIALAAALFAGLVAGPAAAGPAPAPTVVELFTSQGCSSCPPADALLGRLAARPDVVALAYHITYWDRIGWPDPFGTAWGTARQADYVKALGGDTLYTPEMVVDGRRDVVGSRADAVDRALAQSRARNGRLAVAVAPGAGGGLTVTLPAGPAPARPAAVLLARTLSHRTTRVGAGENGGHTLNDYAIVVSLTRIGSWDGHAATLTIPLASPDPRFGTPDGAAVLVQARNGGLPGPILAAGRLVPAGG